MASKTGKAGKGRSTPPPSTPPLPVVVTSTLSYLIGLDSSQNDPEYIVKLQTATNRLSAEVAMGVQRRRHRRLQKVVVSRLSDFTLDPTSCPPISGVVTADTVCERVTSVMSLNIDEANDSATTLQRKFEMALAATLPEELQRELDALYENGNNPVVILTGLPVDPPTGVKSNEDRSVSPPPSPTTLYTKNAAAPDDDPILHPGAIAGVVATALFLMVILSWLLMRKRRPREDAVANKELDGVPANLTMTIEEDVVGVEEDAPRGMVIGGAAGHLGAGAATYGHTEQQPHEILYYSDSQGDSEPVSVADQLDSLIEMGDWTAVGATAALMAAASSSDSQSAVSSNHGGARITESDTEAGIRAAELDYLVKLEDWEGVVAATARFKEEDSHAAAAKGGGDPLSLGKEYSPS